MIITCPCEKKQFEIDDKLIPEKGKLLQCGSCDRKWFFKKTIEVKKKIEKGNIIIDVKILFCKLFIFYHSFF